MGHRFKTKQRSGLVLLVVIIASMGLAGGCGRGLPLPSTQPASTSSSIPTSFVPTPTPLTSPLSTLSTGITPTVTPSTSTTPAATSLTRIEEYVTDLDVPWEMAFSPDGRIFVTERPGRIVVIKDQKLLPEPWATLDVEATGEGGLLGLALDPQFATNHFVYVAYTYRSSSGALRNKIARLTDDGSTGKASGEKILLDQMAGGSIHDGGRLKFGPDGKLYYTIGETGNSGLAQDLTRLNGKILRLNSDGTIPTDNPFGSSFVFSYGNRNPEGLAWQPGTARLYATEHGPSAHDEVNYIEAGKNYGWPVITGTESRQDMVTPIIQSGSDTWAPSGATFVVGGPWEGSFVFGGLRGESLYRLTLDKEDPRKVIRLDQLFTGKYGRLRDVVQGPDGALYILTNNRDGRGNPGPGDDKILRLS